MDASPVRLAALNRTFLNVVELIVRAALTDNLDHVYPATCSAPAIPPPLRDAATCEFLRYET